MHKPDGYIGSSFPDRGYPWNVYEYVAHVSCNYSLGQMILYSYSCEAKGSISYTKFLSILTSFPYLKKNKTVLGTLAISKDIPRASSVFNLTVRCSGGCAKARWPAKSSSNRDKNTDCVQNITGMVASSGHRLPICLGCAGFSAGQMVSPASVPPMPMFLTSGKTEHDDWAPAVRTRDPSQMN